MKYRSIVIYVSLAIVLITLVLYGNFLLSPNAIQNTLYSDNDARISRALRTQKQKNPPPPIPATSTAQFVENFSTTATLKEAGDITSSISTDWWVSSGAYLYSSLGIGNTILGDLPALDSRRVSYAFSNPLDTDNGYHPQNIFRLVQRGTWKNFAQQSYFKIVQDNLSDSPNRNSSNGLLFFNRYKDAFNLYYTGIRVDGYATIKKKINGTYYTLAYKPYMTISSSYDSVTNPDMLPKQQWIGMRSEVVTNTNGTVSIKLFTDVGKTGNWALVAEAVDDGVKYGGPVFTEGHAGIRTDFMDVLFDDYSVTPR